MGWALGVDLGTTYSAAAIAKGGNADRVPLGNRSAVIPSVVCLREDGEVLVGEAAKRRGLLEPTRTAREFKRRLGDPTPLLLGGTPYGAEALMAHLLTWVAARVQEQQGSPPDAVVLSHPANWGPYKLDLLQQAVRLAEVDDVSFLTEPEAAAVHYARQERLEPGEVVAVYDFGGGTFDAAVLRHTGGGFELLGTPEGMERIGGIDFDQAVFAHVDSALGGAVRELDPDDSSAMAAVSRLRDECQLAKEQLSQDTDVDIPVLLPGLQTEVRLTRAEFESMIRPRVGETIRALHRAVRSADLTIDDVAKVLLVGGSSRIPLVGELIREETGRPIAVDAHPKFAIAIGAALIGAEGAARATPDVSSPTVPVPAADVATADVDPSDATTGSDVTDDWAVAEVAPAVADAATVAGDADATAPLDIDDTPDASPAGAAPVDPAPTEEVSREPTPTPVAGAGGGAGSTDDVGDSGGGATPPSTPNNDEDGGPSRMLLVVGGLVALLLVAVVLSQVGGADPVVDPTIAATPSSDPADDSEDDPSEQPSDDPSEQPVDPDTTVDAVTVADDGTVEIAYATAGYELGDAGYGLEIGWVDEWSRPIPDAPYQDVAATSTSPWRGFDTLTRPVAASGVCVQTVTPGGEQPVEDEQHCAAIDEAVRTGMPGERFVRLDGVVADSDNDVYVVDYTTFGYTPELGGEGTWHVHFFYWPRWSEDIVGVNIPEEDRGKWVAWADPVFDFMVISARPEDATHICGVVAEYDHTIMLQEDGTGYPSGTCVALS